VGFGSPGYQEPSSIAGITENVENQLTEVFYFALSCLRAPVENSALFRLGCAERFLGRR